MRRITTIFLALLLTLSLTACGGTAQPNPPAQTGDDASQTETPDTAPEPAEEPEEPAAPPVSPEKPLPEEESGKLPPSEENPSDWAPSEPEQRIDPWAIQEKRSLTVRVVDEEGNPVIYFPAGTVTDEANGEQSFRIPKLYQ